MKPIVAVLADCANIEAHGKLNIMGIFDVLSAFEAPVVHPQMQLVVRFVADASETEIQLPVEVQMVDEDGRTVISIKAQMQLQRPPSGEQVTGNYVIALNNTRFERFGDYEFKFLVADEPLVTVPLRVQQVRQQV